jgi:hypothetical protein
MSTGWKIFCWVAGILGALLVAFIALVVGCVLWMQGIAKDIYGGPLPHEVASIVAFDLTPNKMGVYLDRKTNMMAVVVTQPNPKGAALAFSSANVKKEIHEFDKTHQLESLFEGVDKGTDTNVQLGKQTVHLVEYASSSTKRSWAGILNLDTRKLIFMTGFSNNTPNAPTGGVESVAKFLNEIPIVKNDSRMKR